MRIPGSEDPDLRPGSAEATRRLAFGPGHRFSTVTMSASVLSATSGKKILSRIRGVELVEPEYWKRDNGLCCGASGAQMWMKSRGLPPTPTNRVPGGSW